LSSLLSRYSVQLAFAGGCYAALSLLANGYVFGVADHNIHLAFLDMARHAGRWDGDLLATAARHHHSLFWTLQAPLADSLGVANWTALAYLISLVTTGAAAYHLSLVLWARTSTAILSLSLLAPAQFALGGVDTLDPLLLNRTAALPLELLAVALLYVRRPMWSFVALGLAANLHVPSAAALTAALAALHWSKLPGESKSYLLLPLLCPLLALPVLIPWFTSTGTPGTEIWVDGPWRAVLEARMSHHLFAATWHADEWLKMGFWLSLGALCLSLRQRPEAARFVMKLIGALCLWALTVAVLLGDSLGLALALQLEAWQAFRFVTILCAMGAVAALVELPQRGLPRAASIAALVAVLAASLQFHERAQRRYLPGGEHGEIRELGQWLEGNVPQGTKVMVPPVGLEQLRWRSLRPSTLHWKDGGEALFSRSFALNWKREMERGCACRPFPEPLPSGARPGVRLAELRARLRTGHAAMTARQLRDTAQLTKARYLVTRSGLDLTETDLESVYAGPTWSVYSARHPQPQR